MKTCCSWFALGLPALGVVILAVGIVYNVGPLFAQAKPSQAGLANALSTGIELSPNLSFQDERSEAICDSVSEIPSLECQGLVAFYSVTRGSQWSYNQGWLANSRPCSWVGVACENGHVTSLSLSFNLISGIVPSEIGNLTKLRSLNLIRNKITSIPAEIGQLAELRELYLTGNRLRRVPAEIGELRNLTVLHLSDNGITRLPPEIGELEKLDVLHLRNASLFEIPQEIQMLTNLRELYYTTGSVSAISSALAYMTRLEVLSLPGNQLSLFPPSIAALTNLRQLDLSNNNLVDIPPEIGQLTQLESLDLSTNQIAHLPDEVATLKSLEILDLSNNQLVAVPTGIGLLLGLERLDIGSNQIAELPTEMGYLTNLYQGLHLGYNRLGDLPPAVKSSRFLRSGWQRTQTVAPSQLNAVLVDGQRGLLTWSTIPYTDSSGYYEVSMAEAADGPYKVLGRTRSKNESTYNVNLHDPGVYHFIVRTYTSAHEEQSNYLWSDYSSPAIIYFSQLIIEQSETTVGANVDVWLRGFPPSEPTTLLINDTAVVKDGKGPGLTTDSTGSLQFSLDTSSADPGYYRLSLSTEQGTKYIIVDAELSLNEPGGEPVPDNEPIVDDDSPPDEERSSSDHIEDAIQIPSGLAVSTSQIAPGTLTFLPFTSH